MGETRTKTKWIIGFIMGVLVMGSFLYLVMPNESEDNPYPKSDYTKCIESARDRTCEIKILQAMGYDDNIDCIMDYDNLICDFDRYNADVNASNECFGKKPNIFDCYSLIK